MKALARSELPLLNSWIFGRKVNIIQFKPPNREQMETTTHHILASMYRKSLGLVDWNFRLNHYSRIPRPLAETNTPRHLWRRSESGLFFGCALFCDMTSNVSRVSVFVEDICTAHGLDTSSSSCLRKTSIHSSVGLLHLTTVDPVLWPHSKIRISW